MDKVKVLFCILDTNEKPINFINSFGVKEIHRWEAHPIADSIVFEISEEDYEKLPHDIFKRKN